MSGPQTAPRCECGHPKDAHGPQEYPGRTGETARCHATIYETIERGPGTAGMNAWPCKCQRFKEAETVQRE